MIRFLILASVLLSSSLSFAKLEKPTKGNPNNRASEERHRDDEDVPVTCPHCHQRACFQEQQRFTVSMRYFKHEKSRQEKLSEDFLKSNRVCQQAKNALLVPKVTNTRTDPYPRRRPGDRGGPGGNGPGASITIAIFALARSPS